MTNPIKDEWQSGDGSVRLILGDCVDVMPMLGRVDAIVTDPPYGINANNNPIRGKWADKIVSGGDWDQSRPPDCVWPLMLGMSSKICIWGGNYFADKLPPTMKWLVWDKGSRDFSMADCELAWTSVDAASRIFSMPRNYRNEDDKWHPTQKPVRLMSWCIMQIGLHAGDLVLDPYMGSCSTGVASVQAGCRFVGIDNCPDYFAKCVDRISNCIRKDRGSFQLRPKPRPLVGFFEDKKPCPT